MSAPATKAISSKRYFQGMMGSAAHRLEPSPFGFRVCPRALGRIVLLSDRTFQRLDPVVLNLKRSSVVVLEASD